MAAGSAGGHWTRWRGTCEGRRAVLYDGAHEACNVGGARRGALNSYGVRTDALNFYCFRIRTICVL